MLILPAIDLMGGEVVRLLQGKAEQKTVYSQDPVSVARRWEREGGDYLHLVDLDAAFGGELANLELVSEICQALHIPCELGGGMRTLEAIERAIQAGVARVVIGSRACESLDFVRDAVKAFGGERIAVGIDAKDGKVAVKGWVELSDWGALDLAGAVVALGVQTIIYTDISTDGMLAGPNLKAQAEMVEAVPIQIVASGGVSSLEDIRQLKAIPGLYGTIIGKALYDQKVSLNECLSLHTPTR
ncbi:MAG: 1-(5-phosphoribosyl)-5-[(5-phosphoribosylamino)methylideneamino]imidazole-4-carboxamide isomerase [Blastochloris sp.]|nr:1-(5-phosphoribosyl)-5-[(5-phosphoribosylamino)methylideneamino]imidazole-4-carboxamide isomerase [Blastochloris sp.]